jgi:hypothetical protein
MNPAKPGMDPKTLKVFLGSLLAYTGLFIWILRLRLRLLNLEGMQEVEFVHNAVGQEGKLEPNDE